jgi:uncharacterized tellurite resistance protein B-like protein
MNLSELNDDEKLALAALLARVALADGEVSEAEIEEVVALADEMEEEGFRTLFTYAQTKFTDDESAIELANSSVTRLPSRELILTILSDLANTDGANRSETLVIQKMRNRWV